MSKKGGETFLQSRKDFSGFIQNLKMDYMKETATEP